MDVVFEIEGKFRITHIPFVSDSGLRARRLREPFLIQYRLDGVKKAESVQLTDELFRAIVGCGTPDVIRLMRKYIVQDYAMSDGMLEELLRAPACLAELAYMPSISSDKIA